MLDVASRADDLELEMGNNAYLGIQAAVTRSALDRVLYSAVRAQEDAMCKRMNKKRWNRSNCYVEWNEQDGKALTTKASST